MWCKVKLATIGVVFVTALALQACNMLPDVTNVTVLEPVTKLAKVQRPPEPDLTGGPLTGTMFAFYDSLHADINCDVLNKGTAAFYVNDTLNFHFIRIKVMRLEDGKCWEYFKDDFDPVGGRIDTQAIDRYLEKYTLFGRGSYIAVQDINYREAYDEISTRNNRQFFGFIWKPDTLYDESLGYWQGYVDTTLVTPKNQNRLLHVAR